MFAEIKSAALMGIDAYPLDVEVDITSTVPSFIIVGLPDASVNESKERVRSAILNSGFTFPCRRITVNMAPADVRKEGSSFDLPIALGILCAAEQLDPQAIRGFLIAGELALDGKVRKINGTLPITAMMEKYGPKKIILPRENAHEATLIPGIDIYPADSLKEAVEILRAPDLFTPHRAKDQDSWENDYDMDFSDVQGQDVAKRALEVAGAGGHNLLMIGPPGSGKTMLARRLPTILPSMLREEALEVTRIYSITGMIPQGKALITERPFRSPHHSASRPGLIGGGGHPRPGEVSLAHRGVLFLDELPEFDRATLEVLRQPLEDGRVTISRANLTLTFPAAFMLLAAMNPCPCGFASDPARECSCSGGQIRRYLTKISGPLMDRIDIHIEVPRLKYHELEHSIPGEKSADIRQRVEKARSIQVERYEKEKFNFNSDLGAKQVRKYCRIPEEGKSLLKTAMESLGLSARAHTRILKVARTIADLEGSRDIMTHHLAEAIQYRSLDRQGWL